MVSWSNLEKLCSCSRTWMVSALACGNKWIQVGTYMTGHANSAYFRLFLGYFGVISATRPPLDLAPPFFFLHILDPPLCPVSSFALHTRMMLLKSLNTQAEYWTHLQSKCSRIEQLTAQPKVATGCSPELLSKAFSINCFSHMDFDKSGSMD